jgi:hypothetical protein
MTLLLALTLIFSDPAKTKPVFIPADAFNAPQRYGLARDVIAQLDRDMTASIDARRAIGDDGECATAPPQLPGDVNVTGTIVELTAGWNADYHVVTSLGRVRLQSGEEVLVEFPFGSMRLGRTTWCTGNTQLKTGDTITFNARRAASVPARLICVSLPDHHGRNE